MQILLNNKKALLVGHFELEQNSKCSVQNQEQFSQEHMRIGWLLPSQRFHDSCSLRKPARSPQYLSQNLFCDRHAIPFEIIQMICRIDEKYRWEMHRGAILSLPQH